LKEADKLNTEQHYSEAFLQYSQLLYYCSLPSFWGREVMGTKASDLTTLWGDYVFWITREKPSQGDCEQAAGTLSKLTSQVSFLTVSFVAATDREFKSVDDFEDTYRRYVFPDQAVLPSDTRNDIAQAFSDSASMVVVHLIKSKSHLAASFYSPHSPPQKVLPHWRDDSYLTYLSEPGESWLILRIDQDIDQANPKFVALKINLDSKPGKAQYALSVEE
jgi:hypothetical protein